MNSWAELFLWRTLLTYVVPMFLNVRHVFGISTATSNVSTWTAWAALVMRSSQVLLSSDAARLKQGSTLSGAAHHPEDQLVDERCWKFQNQHIILASRTITKSIPKSLDYLLDGVKPQLAEKMTRTSKMKGIRVPNVWSMIQVLACAISGVGKCRGEGSDYSLYSFVIYLVLKIKNYRRGVYCACAQPA